MKMLNRRSMFLGLAGGLTAALGLTAAAEAAPAAIVPAMPVGDATSLDHLPTADAQEEGDVELAQFRGRRRGPRCWNETQRIRFRDRWGRMRIRTVTRRVCR
jgi:hypothetical protein